MPYLQKHGDTEVVPLWINGKDLPVDPERIFEVIHAADNKTVHHAQAANVDDAKAAVAAASAAFPAWSKTPAPERRKIIMAAGRLLAERAEEIGKVQASETASQPWFGAHMSTGGAATIEEIAAQITTACEGMVPTATEDGNYSMVIRQAIGPVLFISPWNSPGYLGPRGIATALAAGCTVVLKASELCPLTYRIICQVFADAGVPDGVVNQVVTSRENAAAVTETIIADPRIRKVEFIGSATVGSIIGQLCGKYLKPILMELGGKSPAIICHDADLERAAKACAFGAFLHHGQICMSTERIFVVKEVAEEFTALLKQQVEGWAEQAGSAATKQFADKAHAILEEARAEGAEFLVGDNSFHGEHSTSLRPTIVTGVKPGHRLFDDETFGPSASLYVVDNEEEALELANNTKYGLIGCVWAKDTMRGLNLVKRLECGVVSVNEGTLIPDIPPTLSGGASKGSGWGAANATLGIQEFLQLKAIMVKP